MLFLFCQLKFLFKYLFINRAEAGKTHIFLKFILLFNTRLIDCFPPIQSYIFSRQIQKINFNFCKLSIIINKQHIFAHFSCIKSMLPTNSSSAVVSYFLANEDYLW